ncbi:hypothetical protein C8R43DRAFT_1008390 [Mycena crocata]|nr:hypothetical protein C8R43DRAFT_1008390 [Mycena crocata]
MQLSGSEVGALSVFCSYFSIIAGLFVIILRSLSWRTFGTRAYVFIALTLGSFAHTWFYMFKFMAWSFAEYEQSKRAGSTRGLPLIKRMSAWLLNTSLFEQAWANVCFGQLNWWWSQQLCLFTVGALTIHMSIEGRRHQVKLLWAYMLLGQLVAISVASNLFWLSLTLEAPPPPVSRASSLWAPAVLWVPVLISLGAVALSPLTDDRTFLPNLLVMHSLIIVPLLASDALFPGQSQKNRPSLSMGLSTLYIIVFAAALALHTRITSIALGDPAASVLEFAQNAWTTLHSHPAQSSIGWDVVWTSFSFVIWLVMQPTQESQGRSLRLVTATYLLLATPLVSAGVLAPHVLRPRNEDVEDKKDA